MQDLMLVIILMTCLITDLKKRRIYNLVLLPALLFGFSYNFLIGGWSGLWQSLLGLAVGMSILIIPFICGGMGAGDVKLLAVIGAVKGPLFVFYTAIGMGLAGGATALIILIYQRRLMSLISGFLQGVWLLLNTRFKVFSFELEREKIMFPYGLAIVIGAMGAYWWM